MVNLPSGEESGQYFESTKVLLFFMSLDKIQIYFLDSKLLRSVGVLCTNVYMYITAEKRRIKTQAEEFAFFSADGDNPVALLMCHTPAAPWAWPTHACSLLLHVGKPGALGSWNKWLQGQVGTQESCLLVLFAEYSTKKQHRRNWVTNNHGY